MEPVRDDSRRALQAAFEAAVAYLASLNGRSVAATASLDQLRAQWLVPLSEAGAPPEQIIREMAAQADPGTVASAGGRFFGWVIGGSLPAALAADWLTSVWDQNAALFACSPAAAVIEEAAGAWLKDLLGLPSEAAFALVTGCQMAHVTCLAAARHAVLDAQGWDLAKSGLFGAPAITVFTSGARHATTDRALRLLGIGAASIRLLETDEQDRLRPAALEAALRGHGPKPAIVVLQAGEINLGAFDDFAALIPIARAHRAWVHVDGAFGLWAAASPRHRQHVRGIELADSWATDGHKWLNVPYDCGYAFVARPDALRCAMTAQAAYITHDDLARNPVDFNPEWSRRGRGFATYAALRQLGRTGVAELIDRCSLHAQALVRDLGRLPGAELLWAPTLNQGLVRFLHPRLGATEADHDRRTDQVIGAIAAEGEAFFTGTTWRGRRAMRISVCNWQTSARDVERAIAAAARVLQNNLPD
ncbi:MAG TPA: pyridoxal-dependent decarboxylase [Terriglobales bacterium]|nr:pyridoxal-dependent decarboxylase [Terriglobales bacterium]